MKVGNITGRAWAYIGAVLGGTVSIAANVAHSYVPPTGRLDWHPHTGAVVGAVFWPVALFVVVEIFARIPWPEGVRWIAMRFGGLLPVALVAAVVSYRHLSGLLAFYGEDVLTTRIGPLAVDGLMVMASGALVATAAHRVPLPAYLGELVDAQPDLDAASGSLRAPAQDSRSSSPVIRSAARRTASPQRLPEGALSLQPSRGRPPKATRAMVDAYIAANPDASQRTIARHVGVSVNTLRPLLAEVPDASEIRSSS